MNDSQTCITAEGESGKDPEGILFPRGKMSLIDKLVASQPRANKCFFYLLNWLEITWDNGERLQKSNLVGINAKL